MQPALQLSRADAQGEEPITAVSYGYSAGQLERLRRLVEQRCPAARFAGHTRLGTIRGQYRFAVIPHPASERRSAYVQAPITPTGKPRNRHGLWRFSTDPRRRHWYTASSVHEVVSWICAEASR